MSIVVICDRCGRKIEDEQDRVILQATRYTKFDQENADVVQIQPVAASAPPGTMTPPAGPGNPMPVGAVPGNPTQFTTAPAFDGQMEMHVRCWDDWLKAPGEETAEREETDEKE